MCGFSGNVETFRDPLRYKVGVMITGRIERADRANVPASIVTGIMSILKKRGECCYCCQDSIRKSILSV